jgi:hypothetical protein
LASRIFESNDNRDRNEDDDETLFAELEAELDNDDSSAMREYGLSVLRQE